MTIQSDFVKCFHDTYDNVNPGAAKRLGPLLDYKAPELVASIQHMIRSAHNKINGWENHRCGGMSLEDIVIKYEVFTPEDKKIAKQTLGLK